MIWKHRNECVTDLSHVLSQDSANYEDPCLGLYLGSHACHDCEYSRNFEEELFSVIIQRMSLCCAKNMNTLPKHGFVNSKVLSEHFL